MFQIAMTDLYIDNLVRSAQERMRQGDLDDAARIWTQVRSQVPDHPQALFYLGRYRLHRRDVRGALELLGRAAELTPKEPAVHLNMAYAYQALDAPNEEMKALDMALAADPYFVPAIMLKGALLERQGKRRQAAKIYRDGLIALPPAAQLPAELAAQADHAREIVRLDLEELSGYLEPSLAQIRTRHGSAQTARFDECKDILIGTKKIFLPKPALLYFPGVPPLQFYPREDFPWLADVEAQTDIMREELLRVIEEDTGGFRPYVNHPDGIPPNQWVALNHSPKWSAFFLWENDQRFDENCARCPRTAAILASVPHCDIPGFAPTGFFSLLQPKTRIPPHHGTTNIRLTVHIPLIIPENCGFRVGNDTRLWELGKALVFDDTIEHEAWNESDKLRAVFIFDIWNPYLHANERDLVSELLANLRNYYSDE